MSDYQVNYSELRSASEQFDAMQQTAANHLSTMGSVALGQPDFGRIPWLQTRVYEAFVDHTTECRQALDDLREALETTGDGLEGCAEAYEGVERVAAEAIEQFFAALTG